MFMIFVHIVMITSVRSNLCLSCDVFNTWYLPVNLSSYFFPLGAGSSTCQSLFNSICFLFLSVLFVFLISSILFFSDTFCCKVFFEMARSNTIL
ncbi:hypothetical protein M153_8050003964 [Pseudoloma neurophilia]|uniref:Uncharacterized protein n=1 Tax=Pseudoloma neurophilia TaxID=146866 RepID=A0A0R0M266_9MICR|nr:hypothetical protein M153_8050003964 [Pseudoloma neurophilia]